MSTICIQVINPNTDPGMTQTIAEAARRGVARNRYCRGLSTRRRAVD